MIPVFFHDEQLLHKPQYEWAFGVSISHPETTHRAESILKALKKEKDRFDFHEPQSFPLKDIKQIHSPKMVKTIQASSATLPIDQTYYPSVFPYYRDKSRLDPNNLNHAGAFCFDAGTPLTCFTFAAAAWSAAASVEAARWIADGRGTTAYALCRPPGHHASKDLFGGYCYFNNAALAARHLRQSVDRVAILDIDFHHGNGTQVLFDRDPSVLVINIHGDPNLFYPHFTGFETEIGTAAGKGFNINIPLAKSVDGSTYIDILKRRVIKAIKDFDAKALVISAGFDTYTADPIGAFDLETADFQTIAEQLSHLKLPTVIVQEGGYEETSLGRNVASFLRPFS
jgi:acetoin utilization deacetylase AcuC-like enzyme